MYWINWLYNEKTCEREFVYRSFILIKGFVDKYVWLDIIGKNCYNLKYHFIVNLKYNFGLLFTMILQQIKYY